MRRVWKSSAHKNRLKPGTPHTRGFLWWEYKCLATVHHRPTVIIESAWFSGAPVTGLLFGLLYPAVRAVQSPGTLGMTYAHQHSSKHERSEKLRCLARHEVLRTRPHARRGYTFLVIRQSARWSYCRYHALHCFAMPQSWQHWSLQAHSIRPCGTS